MAFFTGDEEYVTTTTGREKVMAIDRYDAEITSEQVRERIDELKDSAGYEVVRTRNDEVLFASSDEGGCTDYIDREDYDPARVVVRERELDDDDAKELDRLLMLEGEADSLLGRPWRLYGEDYFDENWARVQAEKEYPRIDFDALPFSEIDWDDAATGYRNQGYKYVGFDGGSFYGRRR